MTSVAERKRRKKTIVFAKGGRPRIDGPREANGRVDRRWRAQESAKEARQTVIEARQRVFGVEGDDAGKEEAMTVLGRLRLSQQVSVEQMDAAKRWQEIRNRYRLAMGLAPDYSETRSDEQGDGACLDEWISHVRSQYASMCGALNDLCVEVRSPAPKAALEVIVIRDVDMPELVGALRLALNALARHLSGDRPRSRFVEA